MKIYKIKRILRNLSQRKIGGEDELLKSKTVLLEFIRRYPVRKSDLSRHFIKMQPQFLQLIFKPMSIIAGLLIAALLGGGGVAYASQGSLPGDTLYPIKLMTEDVQTVVAWSPEKKVELEAKFANRRLEEIQRLQERLKKKKSEISTEIIEKAMERAKQRLERAEEQITQMEEGKLKERALEAASRLEEALETHQQILSDLAGEIPKPAEQALLHAQEVVAKHSAKVLERILKLERTKAVGEKLKERIKERERKPQIIGAKERAEGKLKAIENRLVALERYIENLKEQGREVGNYQAKLNEAKAKVEEAKKLIEEEKYLEAFDAANAAMRLMMEVKLLLRPILMPRPLPVEGPGPMPFVNEQTQLPTESSEQTILPLPESVEQVESVNVELAPVPLPDVSAE